MYGILLLSVLLMTANTALTKVFQRSVRFDLKSMAVYNLLNALLACVIFFATAGFRIRVNVPTLIYALIYAAIICVNLSAQILALALVPVPVTTLMSVAGGVLLPSVFGVVWYGEPLTVRLVLSILLILLATALPLWGGVGTVSGKGVAACVVMFLLGGASVILVQLYSRASGVCDSNSFFFLTNAVIAALCLGLTLGGGVRQGIRDALFLFSPKQLGMIGGKTVLANLCSMLQVLILRQMAASTYAVLNSSLSLLGSVALSAVCFREKQTKKGLLAVLFAIAALAVNP